jgi:hypothetical protein
MHFESSRSPAVIPPEMHFESSRSPAVSPVISSDMQLTRGNFKNLTEIFPHLCQESIKFVFSESGEDFTETTNCLVNGPTLDSIRSLLKKCKIIIPLAESPRIRLDPDDDQDDWVSAAVTYYKSSQFDRHSEVRISLRGQPAVDTGGVRRQFFDTIFERITTSETY